MDEVLSSAYDALEAWIEENDGLCEIKDADFDEGYPYHLAHMQAVYLLRYYPAYFAENYAMFQEISGDGGSSPDIVSIGCGSLVDAAAAGFVFDDTFTYVGYDINDWRIKGVNIVEGGRVSVEIQDVFGVESWSEESDVFCFSKSLRDLFGRIDELRDSVASTDFCYDNIYVCATYNSAPGHIRAQHRDGLRRFAGFFGGYTVRDFAYMNGAVPGVQGVGIRSLYDWWVHSKSDYCASWFERCRKNEVLKCADGVCRSNLRKRPVLNLAELGYEILKLERNNVE